MNVMKSFLFGFAVLLAVAGCQAAVPGASGDRTVVQPVDENYLTDADPTAYTRITYQGIEEGRSVLDMRSETGGDTGTVVTDVYVYDAGYSDHAGVRIYVLTEIGSEEVGRATAVKWAERLGRLPDAIRYVVTTLYIYPWPDAPFPGRGGSGDIYLATVDGLDSWWPRLLIHEAAHSLEWEAEKILQLEAPLHESDGWVAAQEQDGVFPSEYAEEYPQREDFAESFELFAAVRLHRADQNRVSRALVTQILRDIPARIAWIDRLLEDDWFDGRWCLWDMTDCGPTRSPQGRPELTIDELSYSYYGLGIRTGDRLQLTAEVWNQGDAAANATTIRYYISENHWITPNDEPIGTAMLVELGADSRETGRLEFTAPQEPGTYYYGACVDAVPEEYKGFNNCSYGVEIEVEG